VWFFPWERTDKADALKEAVKKAEPCLA